MTVQETKIKCGTSHVYEKYRSEISERIAYIEVYEHDFPAEIMAQMAELFQTIVLYETDDDFLNNDKLQCLLEDTFHKVNRYLDKHTTYVILQKIKQYKKIFKKYLTNQKLTAIIMSYCKCNEGK